MNVPTRTRRFWRVCDSSMPETEVRGPPEDAKYFIYTGAATRHENFQARRKSFTLGLNATSLSRGKIGRRQRVWPSLRKFALVAPGASTFTKRVAQAEKNRFSQWGDLTTTRSNRDGSWP